MRREIQPKTKLSATAERDEAARLEDIETFQRRHLAAWLDSIMSVYSLSPADILAVLDFAGSYGLEQNFQTQRWCVGWTLPEIATELFRAANLRTGERIPDRDVVINPKRTEIVAQMIAETLPILKISGK